MAKAGSYFLFTVLQGAGFARHWHRRAGDNTPKMPTVSPLKSGAYSGKKMTMASALFGEKMAHLRADLRLGLYKLSHPALPKEDREVAQESNIVQKSVATGTCSLILSSGYIVLRGSLHCPDVVINLNLCMSVSCCVSHESYQAFSKQNRR